MNVRKWIKNELGVSFLLSFELLFNQDVILKLCRGNIARIRAHIDFYMPFDLF